MSRRRSLSMVEFSGVEWAETLGVPRTERRGVKECDYISSRLGFLVRCYIPDVGYRSMYLNRSYTSHSNGCCRAKSYSCKGLSLYIGNIYFTLSQGEVISHKPPSANTRHYPSSPGLQESTIRIPGLRLMFQRETPGA
jgi:hypothetical protein